MSLFEELKRRNVFRVGLAYVLMGWVLLQGADFVLDLVGAPEWVIRAFAVLVAIGLPVALFFAWAFELTPEGIKREAEVDRSASVTPTTGRKLDRAIIVLLAAAVAILLVDRFRAAESPAPATQPATASQRGGDPANTPEAEAASGTASVAVLPFRAMSSGPDDEYFADGLTEEILNALTQAPGLAVTSRTSAFYFKDRDLPVRDIAEQLEVAHIVEGSVRRSGDRLRVTAQLIRAADDTHLWSETYDRTDADAIAVQEDIAQRIAETLGVFLDETTLERMRRAGLGDVDAFINYQKGRALHTRAHGDVNLLAMLEEGNQYLLDALEVQPGFTPAWLFYSDFYTHLLLDSATGELDEPLADAAAREAYEEGRRAFTLAARGAQDPDTRLAAELDLAIYEGDAAAWRPLFEQILASDACHDVIWHQLLGFIPEFVERFRNQLERYHVCDPMTDRYTGMRIGSYLWSGQLDTALAVSETDLPGGYEAFEGEWLIRVLTALGRFEEASRMALIDLKEPRTRLQMQTLVAAAGGDLEAAKRFDRQQSERTDDNRFLAIQRAAWLGDRARANALAAEIDVHPLGHLALMMATFWCACGSPFDLEAAPGFAALWERADLPWPLESPIGFARGGAPQP